MDEALGTKLPLNVYQTAPIVAIKVAAWRDTKEYRQKTQMHTEYVIRKPRV